MIVLSLVIVFWFTELKKKMKCLCFFLFVDFGIMAVFFLTKICFSTLPPFFLEKNKAFFYHKRFYHKRNQTVTLKVNNKTTTKHHRMHFSKNKIKTKACMCVFSVKTKSINYCSKMASINVFNAVNTAGFVNNKGHISKMRFSFSIKETRW